MRIAYLFIFFWEKPGLTFSVCSCYLVRDSSKFLSPWGWANPVVSLSSRPLIMLLAGHALVCQWIVWTQDFSLSLESAKSRGTVSCLGFLVPCCYSLGCGWPPLPQGTVQCIVRCCCLTVVGSCCPLRLWDAFLQNCSFPGCPPACPVLWVSLIWGAVSVALSLVFNSFCTQVYSTLPSLYVASWDLGLLWGNGLKGFLKSTCEELLACPWSWLLLPQR